MAAVLEYPDILQEVRGAMEPGRLKMQASNVIFKNTKTGRMDTYTAEDIRKARWLLRARGYCLRFKLLNGTIHKYDGFKETEYDKVSAFVEKNYKTELVKVEPSVKGWNWGTADFDGNALEFRVDGKLSFEVPLTNVSNCVSGKNEVTVEYHQNDDAPVCLTEMRFFLPADKNLDVDTEDDSVELFRKKILDKADIIQATGDAITTFSEVQCLTPRGRYDIKLFPSFLQLHGKTFDYKIPYATILRLFLLPHRDGRQMFFVISLDPPIKQGQTRYHFLILLFNKEDETTLELGLTEEEIQEKYEGKLTKEMAGLEYEIISRLMKTLVNRKITVPGSFMGQSGSHSVGCSYKAATGFLYPLERGFIFVHKPPMHIRFDEVSSVNFARSSGSTRSFDFDINTKTGTTYTFVGIDKDEYSRLYDFVKGKKIRLQNLGDGKKAAGGDYDDMLDSDEGSDHDAYLERMKREGKSREEEDEDDDDESDDEDYHIPDEYSEVDEEYDTDAVSSGSSSSDDDSDSGEFNPDKERERKERREKRKAEKKAKKQITIKEPGTEKKTAKKRKSKSKADKDPNRPKRPMTAYFLWLNENREKLKEQVPDASVTELSKKAGEIWRGMEAEDKKKYEEENVKLKAEYDIVMVEYNKNKPDSPPREKKAKKSSSSAGKSAKPSKSKSSKDSSPTKAASGSFKSKEYISDSSSNNDSDGDSDEKPLKKKSPEKKEKKESKESKPEKRASHSKKEIDSDASDASLPSDHEEDILSSPEHSEGGSDSGSDSD